ncbi:stage II sporulation protein M [Alicyclobacillus macrosporangiidus]|uniref:Stage II sporulation protein M n=1 Tax=Alicyclobacillus macrosporangiidus TaxID=392015 RepID=A0A1I7I8Z0_9BACL|nr:stage II sporulation protein M [Alicyclobacillus macrosporangiidus]SFU69398.1 Stage II sporulation protein M [Alicyclobacillus macrosporangiidus]
MQPVKHRLFLWLWALAAAVLAAGFISGYTAPDQFGHALAPTLEKLEQLAESARTGDGSGIGMWTVFVNNALVALLLLATGVFAGVIPVLVLWFNGLLIGYVVQVGASHLGVSAWRVLVYSMLPHGVFELAGLMWAASWGLYLGYVAVFGVADRIRTVLPGTRGGPRPKLRKELVRACVRVPGVLALLAVAAWIETALTPAIMGWGLPLH